MKPPSYVIILTTVKSIADAVRLAGIIVEAKLAACVQFWPIRSTYRWKGKMVSGREHLLLCKTRAQHTKPLQSLIRTQHSYELPEIVTVPINAGLPDYLNWITAETRSPITQTPSRRGKSLTFHRRDTKSGVAKKRGKP